MEKIILKHKIAFKDIRDIRLKAKNAANMIPLRIRLVAALSELFDSEEPSSKKGAPTSFQKAFHQQIVRELEDRSLPYPENVNFGEFIVGVIKKKVFLDIDSFNQVEQDVWYKLLAANSAGEFWFDLFKKRYYKEEASEEDNKSELLNQIKSAVQKWVLNWLRDNKGKEVELKEKPDEEDLSIDINRLDIEEESFLKEIEDEELVNDIEKALSKHNHGDLLLGIFTKLLEGYTKKEISESLGFKSQSRLAYYLTEMKTIILNVFKVRGDEELVEKLGLLNV